MGNVDIAGCVCRRSPHLQVISSGALTEWPLCSPEIKNAFPQATGFDREVYLRAPREWNSKDTSRVWQLRKPAYRLHGAPAAIHRSLNTNQVHSAKSLSSVGLRRDVSPFDPFMYFVYRKSGSAVGALATHIDDILGCGVPDLLVKVRGFSDKRCGEMEAQEESPVPAGMELGQEKDFSVTSTHADFTKNLKLLPTPPALWAGRKEPLSMSYIKLRQCASGKLRWVAAVSRPDICARLAPIASRVNSLRRSDVYRINELVRVAKDWQQETVRKDASSSHPWRAPGRGDGVQRKLWKRGERVLCDSMTLAGWRDAAYGGQSAAGEGRVGYVIGLMSSTSKGPCNILQRTPEFTRKIEKSSLGGQVNAGSEMMDRVLSLEEFYGLFGGAIHGAAGLEDCESLLTHLRTKKTITGKYLVRHLSSIQQSSEECDQENANWLPGAETPAGGLPKVRSDMVPLLRRNPRQLSHLKGVAWKK